MKLIIRTKGGPGSGHHDHVGRPGKVGGSMPSDYGVGVAPPPVGEGPADNPWEESLKGKIFLNEGLPEWVRNYLQELNPDNPLSESEIDDEYIAYVQEYATDYELLYPDAPPILRRKVKNNLVTRISEESGLPYDTVNQLIANWAKTSNGNDLRALYIQKDFADQLGLELSDWQKQIIEDLTAEKYRYLQEGLASQTWREFYVKRLVIPGGFSDESAQVATAEYYQKIDEMVEQYIEESFKVDQFNYNDHGGLLPIKLTRQTAEYGLVARASDSHEVKKYFRVYPEADQKKFAQAMYNITQDELTTVAFKPGDTVRLFRGFDTGPNEPKLEWVPTADSNVGYYGNAIESWSASIDVAKNFGNTVLAMDVPIENVIGTCKTGFGCLTEAEFVIYANERGAPQTAYVVESPYVDTTAEDYVAPHDRGDVEYDPNWNPIIQ